MTSTPLTAITTLAAAQSELANQDANLAAVQAQNPNGSVWGPQVGTN